MASGDTLLTWTVTEATQPSSNYATFDVREGTLATRVLDFADSTADESVQFTGVMPQHYAGTTGVTVRLFWMASTATSGDVVWGVSFGALTDDADDIDSISFAAANTVTATTATASGEVDYASVTFTDGADMDSVAAGDLFVLEVERQQSSGSDTMSGDAELIAVEIQET